MPTERERNNQITSRLSPELRRRVDALNRRYLTSDATIITELLTAFCDSVDSADAVRWPVVVMLAEKQQLMVAEHGPGKGGATTPAKPPDKSQRHRGDGPRAKVS